MNWMGMRWWKKDLDYLWYNQSLYQCKILRYELILLSYCTRSVWELLLRILETRILGRIPSPTFLIPSLPSWGSLSLLCHSSLWCHPFFFPTNCTHSYVLGTSCTESYEIYKFCTKLWSIPYYSLLWEWNQNTMHTGIITQQVIISIKIAFDHGNSI